MSTATQTQREAPQTLEQAKELDALEQAIRETERKRHSVTKLAAVRFGVPDDKIYNMMRSIWKVPKEQAPLSDPEVFTGLQLVARYDLDPFTREIFVTRSKQGLLVIVSVDGWIKVLNRTPGYNGFEVEMSDPEDPAKVKWVETRIYSKILDKPIVYRAFKSEYEKLAGIVAKQIPLHMLRIFSLRHAARLFAPIGGNVVTDEEAGWIMSGRHTAEPAADTLQEGDYATVDDLPPPPPADEPAAVDVAQEPTGQPDAPELDQNAVSKALGSTLTEVAEPTFGNLGALGAQAQGASGFSGQPSESDLIRDLIGEAQSPLELDALKRRVRDAASKKLITETQRKALTTMISAVDVPY